MCLTKSPAFLIIPVLDVFIISDAVTITDITEKNKTGKEEASFQLENAQKQKCLLGKDQREVTLMATLYLVPCFSNNIIPSVYLFFVLVSF